MRGAVGALALLVAVWAFPQETATYATADNPFQAEYTYTPGQPIVLRTAVEGVQFDSFTLTAPTPASADEKVTCTLVLDGSNPGGRKLTITAVFLLEDAKGKALERLSMAPFKAKPGRPFTRNESLTAQGSTLTGAGRIYVFLKLD
jgi:hypothetical protein